MTEKKLAANRKNARKSTGPKTSAGKAASSRNAIKHGLLAAAPVLPGVESPEAWEEHRTGIISSLAPVGYLESLFAERIALLAWRLRRVARYEVEVAAASAATAEIDMEEDQAESESGKPEDPEASRQEAEMAAHVVEMLEALPAMPAHKKLDSDVAVAALWALAEELPEERDTISIPGVPDDDEDFEKFDLWTAGLLRKSIEVYAGVARIAPNAMLTETIESARRKYEEAEDEEQRLIELGQKWKLQLERTIRGRMLLAPDVLDKVARYENGLERSLFRNLHELQRLQAARSGMTVTPPAAVDVDLTVQNGGRS